MHFPKTPGRADKGVLHLRAVSKAAASAAAAADHPNWGGWALGGTGCGPGATAFAVGTFERDSDKGPVVGCFSPTSGIFYGVFKSTKYNVEGGLSGSLSGPMNSGVFPAQPRNELTTTFIGHFAGDGAAAEEKTVEVFCGGNRKPSAVGAAHQEVPAQCELDRVTIDEQDTPKKATSRRVFENTEVVFLGRVLSPVVPAAVVITFPAEVRAGDVTVYGPATRGVTCPKSVKVPDLVCRLDTRQGRIAVIVKAPSGTVKGYKLEVQLRIARPRRPGETEREWLTTVVRDQVAVDAVVIPAPPSPTAPPPPKSTDPIEGSWQGFVPSGAQARTRFDEAFPKADLQLARAKDADGNLRNDLYATTAKGNVDLFLNETGTAKAFDGTAQTSGTAVLPIKLELIPAGSKAVRFPGICGVAAEQAKTAVLCGTFGKGADEKRVILRRVGH